MLVRCVGTFVLLFNQRRHFHLNVEDLVDMNEITEEMKQQHRYN